MEMEISKDGFIAALRTLEGYEDKEFWKDVYVAAIAAGCTSNETVTKLANIALANLHAAKKERGWVNE